MSKFNCTVLFDASNGCTIEADTPEDAADEAMTEHGSVSLCHHCAGEVEVGDPMGALVYDENDNLVLDTTYQGEEINRLRERVAELEALLSKAGGQPSCLRCGKLTIKHICTDCDEKEASKAVPVADERKPSDGDYLRWAEQAGAKVNWDFESTSSARVVFLLASQWGRFCDKVRASQLEPTSKGATFAQWWKDKGQFTTINATELGDFQFERAIAKAAWVAASQQRALSDEAAGEFADWLCREMPPGTVISDPAWWAPKIMRAILAASSGSKLWPPS